LPPSAFPRGFTFREAVLALLESSRSVKISGNAGSKTKWPLVNLDAREIDKMRLVVISRMAEAKSRLEKA